MSKNDPKEKEYIIRLAAQIGAEVGIKAYEGEIAKAKNEKSDRRLRNTKLLLRNYRSFKAHAESAVYDASDADEDAFDIIDLMSDRFGDSDIIVDSIKQSVARTVTIVSHIETMLGLYEAFCENSGNPEEIRRWDVIKGMYIDEVPATTKELANENCVTERTIYRDIDIACERIAALIFGIDGLRKA